MSTLLAEYLSVFEATQTVTPSQSGLVKRPILELQKILHRVGWKKTAVVPDGKYGPKTKKAWAQSSTKRKLNPTFDRAGPTEAWVDPTTYTALSGKAVPQVKPAAVMPKAQPTVLKPVTVATPAPMPEPAPFKPTPVVPESRVAPFLTLPPEVRPEEKIPFGKLVNKSVAELQNILHGLGYTKKKIVPDGLYGPATKAAWQASAVKRNLHSIFERVDGRTAAVDPQTYVRLDAASRQPKPKPKPLLPVAPAAEPGTVVKSVAALQALLYGIGWTKKKIIPDGLYGPKTKGAWATSAKTRKLDQKFERVTGKTARVATETYERFLADARKERKAPAPAPAPARPAPVPRAPAPVPARAPIIPRAAPKPPPGTVIRSVADLQNVLHGVGWSKTQVVPDGLFGPKTQGAWAASARKRQLDPRFERMTGKTARVSAKTYLQLKAIAAKGPAPKVPAAPKIVVPPPSTAKVLVKNVQRGLNGVGIKPLLDTDGIWGSRTQQTFEAWLRSQPGGKQAKYTVAPNRREMTIPRAYALSLAVSGKSPPAPPARVSISVLEVNTALKNTGRQVSVGTVFNAETKVALEDFIRQVDHGVNTGYRVSKDKKTILRIRKNVADRLIKIAKSAVPVKIPEAVKPASPVVKPEAPKVPLPKPEDPIQVAARKVAQQLTDALLVLTVQQALLATEKYPRVKATGVWDEITQDGFVDVIGIAATFKPVRHAAIPLVLSVDRRTVRVTPAEGKALRRMAEIYRERTKVVPVLKIVQPEALPAPEPVIVPARQIVERPRPALPPPPPEVFVPAPAAPLPKMAPQSAQEAWKGLVQGLESLTNFGGPITKAVEEAAAVGLSSEAETAYRLWVVSAQRLLNRTAMLIEQSPKLRQAIDAIGINEGTERDQFAAYFEDFSSAASRAVELLRKPFPVVDIGGESFAGFGVPVLPAVAAVGWATRFAGPAWRGLMALLGSRAVTIIGATAVATGGLDDVVNGEAKAYMEHNKHIANLVAEGKLTPEEGERLVDKPPKKVGVIVPLVLGATALGALAIYLQQQK